MQGQEHPRPTSETPPHSQAQTPPLQKLHHKHYTFASTSNRQVPRRCCTTSLRRRWPTWPTLTLTHWSAHSPNPFTLTVQAKRTRPPTCLCTQTKHTKKNHFICSMFVSKFAATTSSFPWFSNLIESFFTHKPLLCLFSFLFQYFFSLSVNKTFLLFDLSWRVDGDLLLNFLDHLLGLLLVSLVLLDLILESLHQTLSLGWFLRGLYLILVALLDVLGLFFWGLLLILEVN